MFLHTIDTANGTTATSKNLDLVKIETVNTSRVTGQTKVVTAANNWKYEFTDLTKYDAQGKEYVYSVKEIDAPNGYESHVNGTTITNIQLTSLNGEKKWYDDNGYGRPDQITVHLYRKLKDSADEPVDTKQVQVITAKNNWKYEFTNLPKYDENGKEYVYSVKEDQVPGYDVVISNDSQIISNYARTEVEGEKKW